jgi:hypothetical protein
MQEFTGFRGYLKQQIEASIASEAMPTSAANRVFMFHSAAGQLRQGHREVPVANVFDALDVIHDRASRGALEIDAQRIKGAVDGMTATERVEAVQELEWSASQFLSNVVHNGPRGDQDKVRAASAIVQQVGPVAFPRDPIRADREDIARHLPDGQSNRAEMFYEILSRYEHNRTVLTEEQRRTLRAGLGTRHGAIEAAREYDFTYHEQTVSVLPTVQQFELMERLVPEVQAAAAALNPVAGEFAAIATERFSNSRADLRKYFHLLPLTGSEKIVKGMDPGRGRTLLSAEDVAGALIQLGEDATAERIEQVRTRVDASMFSAGRSDSLVIDAVATAIRSVDGMRPESKSPDSLEATSRMTANPWYGRSQGDDGQSAVELRDAARALLDAYGANVPDWLSIEYGRLESAVMALDLGGPTAMPNAIAPRLSVASEASSLDM